MADPPPPGVFQARRERVLRAVGDGVVVLASAPELLLSRDTEIRYRQDSDFYYLTGFEEPDAVAVLTPHDPAHRFTLFARPQDPEREVWSGPRAGVEAAREQFGADAAYPVGELETRLPELLRPASRVYYPVGAHPELDATVRNVLVQARRGRQRSGVGPTGIEDLDGVLGGMRRVKDAVELERMRVAAAIAAAGHSAAMAHARPGIGEWELQAVLEGRFRSLGAAGPAFPSIVGAGPNATILHYVANRERAKPGDLVLLDAGAAWGMYCSDITRTFPVDGRFTAPQRALYEVVLAALDAGIAAARPGAPVTAVHEAAVRELARGLVELALLTGEVEQVIETGAYRRFYMHQTSHWLGLDVHDAGLYREGGHPVPLEPGMVLTVEPGLYVPAGADDVPPEFRGLGIRLEDDVAVTADGCEVLTRDVPVAPDQVEALVGSALR